MISTTSIARPITAPWSSYSWNTAVTTTTLTVPGSDARKRVREEDADIPECKRVRICSDASFDATLSTPAIGCDDTLSGASISRQTTGLIDIWEWADGISGESHSDENKADLSESSSSSPPNVPSGSWTWTAVHGTELPAMKDPNDTEEVVPSTAESTEFENIFAWVSPMTPFTDYPMTPAPECNLSDVVQPTPSTAIRKRLPWKQRKCGSSPLRQSTTPDDLASCHQCEPKGRSPRAPAPLDDNRCTFGRAFLKQRAQFLLTQSSDQDHTAFRCTLYDEDPQLPVRGTPSHAEEEDQPLILPTSHHYYKYTTGKAVKRLTYVDKLDGTYFRGHGAKFARPVPSSAARPLADRISVRGGVSLRLALLDSEHGDGTVTVKADDNAVATWLSHVGMIPMLHLGKLVGTDDMTTGHWVYIDETPEFSPTYSDLELPTIPSP